MAEQKELIKKAAAKLNLDAFVKYESYTDPKLSFEDNLCTLMQEQIVLTDQQRLKRRIRYAGFPQVKTFETFVMAEEFLPNLNFDEFRALGDCGFIEEKCDIVAVGPEGRGKTHAALAIGYEAVKQGYSVRFKRASDLVNEMGEAKSEKQLTDYIRTINRCKLLIVDELGYLNYDMSSASLLFQVLGDRYEKSSTIYTTNLPFSEWRQFIPDEALASAIVGRIAQNAILLNMNGAKNWRLENARSKRQRGSKN